jgi:hypothetical protein
MKKEIKCPFVVKPSSIILSIKQIHPGDLGYDSPLIHIDKLTRIGRNHKL